MKAAELFETDFGKRAFKRAELEWELRHEKDQPTGRGEFNISIDGRVWKDKTTGKPVVFYSRSTAEKAAATMRAKPFNANRRIEVV